MIRAQWPFVSIKEEGFSGLSCVDMKVNFIIWTGTFLKTFVAHVLEAPNNLSLISQLFYKTRCFKFPV